MDLRTARWELSPCFHFNRQSLYEAVCLQTVLGLSTAHVTNVMQQNPRLCSIQPCICGLMLEVMAFRKAILPRMGLTEMYLVHKKADVAALCAGS